MAIPDRGRTVRVGTRGSPLALAQTGQLARRIEELGVATQLVVVRTSGDRLTEVSLARVGGKGLFLKEIEEALSAGEIDLAVHSMKDVPADLPPGLVIAAVPRREDVRDVVIARAAARSEATGLVTDSSSAAASAPGPLLALPRDARVGTGSLRRRAQLLHHRPDLSVAAMRGNVDTRLRKLRAGDADAILLAAAGLARLGLDVPASPLDPVAFLPAPGQGALAVEARDDDREVRETLAPLHDAEAAATCAAERAFLRALGASCQVPVAALARVVDSEPSQLVLDGLVASLDGSTVLRDVVTGRKEDAAALGDHLAQLLLTRGARAVLESAEREAGRL